MILIGASASAVGFSALEYAISSINPVNMQNNATGLFETGKLFVFDALIPIEQWKVSDAIVNLICFGELEDETEV